MNLYFFIIKYCATGQIMLLKNLIYGYITVIVFCDITIKYYFIFNYIIIEFSF